MHFHERDTHIYIHLLKKQESILIQNFVQIVRIFSDIQKYIQNIQVLLS